jgi:preprotein translocase subunit Sss1
MAKQLDKKKFLLFAMILGIGGIIIGSIVMVTRLMHFWH